LTSTQPVPRLNLVKKLIVIVGLGYVVLALIYRAREAAGLLTCDCYPECWCRKPGLSVFRWVFPRYHRNPGLEAWDKARAEASES
jgi:hypothetical protein